MNANVTEREINPTKAKGKGNMTDFPNWSEWKNLNEQNFRDIPRRKGIYIIRIKNRCVERLLGSTPIVYVGAVKTESERTLADRIPECFIPERHVIAPRLTELAKLDVVLEFCFSETDEPGKCEKELLCFFEKIHLELPPLNRQI